MNRNKGLMLFLSVFVMASIFLTATEMKAEWIDDWSSNMTIAEPGFQGSAKRGYASAGSVSIRRQPVSLNPPLQIQLPSFKQGCGGIDVFLGGMNFAYLAEYMEEKLRTLVNQAPVITYQIAIKVLNEQLGSAMDTVQAAIDVLNGLQLSDCGINQSVVNAASSAIVDATGGKNAWSRSIQTKATEIGDGFYQGAMDKLRGLGNSDAKSEAGLSDNLGETISGCPARLQGYLRADSLLDAAIENSSMSVPNDYKEFIRAVVGDGKLINVFDSYHECPPCSELANKEWIYRSNGVRRRDVDGACNIVTGDLQYFDGLTASSPEDWAKKAILNIKETLDNRGSYSTDVLKVLAMSPPSMYTSLVASFLNNTYAAASSVYEVALSKLLIWAIAADIRMTTEIVCKNAIKQLVAQNDIADDCNPGVAVNNAIIIYNNMMRNAELFEDSTLDSKRQAITELEQIQVIIDSNKTRYDRVRKDIQVAFGASLVQRIMGS
jgi:conjugative transfer pilus assembly protein TraH